MNQTKEAELNPTGLNGVDFVEYTGPDAKHFEGLFEAYGFSRVGSLAGKAISLFRQGHINFIVNTQPGTFASEFAKLHGPSICSTGFYFENADHAFKTAVARGAKPYLGSEETRGATPFPAVYGIGDSLIYFIDAKNRNRLYQEIFKVSSSAQAPSGQGLGVVDHFTNNVPVGEMQKWCDFYTKVFNFRETRYFDIRGKSTGLISKVMRSPCGKFAVPINEPSDGKSQIQEYLDEYKGSGIQHVALTTDNILRTLDGLRNQKNEFLSPPPGSYYRMLKDRLPQVSEDIEKLSRHAVLVDGDHEGYLLQIFSKNVIGPIFFEIIQRKNHTGFGEGNFQALFDSIEQDQRERGYIK